MWLCYSLFRAQISPGELGLGGHELVVHNPNILMPFSLYLQGSEQEPIGFIQPEKNAAEQVKRYFG